MATTTETREREIVDLETRFWNAMKAKDPREASQLTDDGCVVVGAQGVSSVDRPTMAKLTAEGQWELEQFNFDEKSTRVRFIGDDVAIVAYTVDERVVVDGKTLPIKANDATVWERRDGEWRCAMHTESLAGDPYGRDRKSSRE
jgi:uncharacterized protein (TIGR02246 family)